MHAKFRTFQVKGTEETILISIVQLDAFITAIIDSFQNAASHSAKENFRDDRTTKRCNFSTDEATKRTDTTPGVNGGTIPFYSARDVEPYLTTSAALFFSDAICFYRDCLRDQKSLHKFELFVRNMSDEVVRFHTAVRFYTTAFCYPKNRQIYIS